MQNISKGLSRDLIGIAGVHFVVSELSLRGLIALPTIRNTSATDILVSEPDGNKVASIQVKTSLKKVTFWPTSHPQKCLSGSNNWYVFLRFLKKENRFEAFLEPATKVVKQVKENWESYKKKGKREFNFWALPTSEEEIRRLRNQWETWRPTSL